jgi:hypothetical protein
MQALIAVLLDLLPRLEIAVRALETMIRSALVMEFARTQLAGATSVGRVHSANCRRRWNPMESLDLLALTPM